MLQAIAYSGYGPPLPSSGKRSTDFASHLVKDIPIGERVEFDYKGRGYHLTDE